MHKIPMRVSNSRFRISHWFEYPCAQEISEPFASRLTSRPSKLATPGNQTPLHCPLYSTLIITPSTSGIDPLIPLPQMVQFISPLTSSTPTLRLPSASTHLTRIRSALGKVPWIAQPSDAPAVDPRTICRRRNYYMCLHVDNQRCYGRREVRRKVPWTAFIFHGG